MNAILFLFSLSLLDLGEVSIYDPIFLYSWVQVGVVTSIDRQSLGPVVSILLSKEFIEVNESTGTTIQNSF